MAILSNQINFYSNRLQFLIIYKNFNARTDVAYIQYWSHESGQSIWGHGFIGRSRPPRIEGKPTDQKMYISNIFNNKYGCRVVSC